MIAVVEKIRQALKVSADSTVRVEIESGGLDRGGTLIKLMAEFPKDRIGELKANNYAWLDELKGTTIPVILFGREHWPWEYRTEIDDVDYIDGCLKLHYFQIPKNESGVAK